MEFVLKDVEGIGVLGVRGELDALTSPELTRFFSNQAADTYRKMVLDLEGLSYSSSAGIRIFLGLARELRSGGGDLRIAAVQPRVDKIFKLSKFDKIVRVFPSVEAALQSYKKEV
jgi:anti-anti-sigma factor